MIVLRHILSFDDPSQKKRSPPLMPPYEITKSSILNAAGRQTGSLAAADLVYVIEIEEEVPGPRAGCIVLRRRPEEGVVLEIAEMATVVPVAARKGSETAAVRSAGIWD